MAIIQAYTILLLAAIILNIILPVKWKGIITLATVIIHALLSGYPAIMALHGQALEYILEGTLITGSISIRIDALSAWFILLINFTLITGALYGFQYMKVYRKQSADIALHCIAYLVIQSTLNLICIVQNTIVFLFTWEIMALSAFLLVIFEHHKHDTIKAGINLIIQSHISMVFLTIGFIWIASRVNSYDFQAISTFSASVNLLTSLALTLCLFTGFAIKAGFVPFHTWLPYAHPAAPSHISGIMSGVMIKIGIYGILRILLLIRTDFIVLGYIFLFVSIISGVYGVMLAIIQHNLKKLLAYHSIENIGIIGIGIGLGTIGIGTSNPVLITLGFAGGMLHVLNHSLFKSLLFYSAGNIYQSTHTMNIEHLGGLIKRLPHTSILFLVASMAICGLPPFNGFISEFLIYSGLFKGLGFDNPISLFVMLSGIFGLSIIGGLAILCFTKAFGAIFLGTPRHQLEQTAVEANTGKLIPMYLTLILMLGIGLMPQFFFQLLLSPLKLFTDKIPGIPDNASPALLASELLVSISRASIGFLALAGLIYFIREKITGQKPVVISSTWGCGYTGNPDKMQYTASSFIRTYRKLAEPLLSIHRKKTEVKGIFPHAGWHETHPGDKTEEWLIDAPLNQVRYFFDQFRFLQNGNPQYYVLYGFVFISLVIAEPILYEAIRSLIEFLNRL